MKEVTPSPDRKMIKLLTFNNLFPPLSYPFDIPAKTRSRVTRRDDGCHFFPPKWRWFTRKHYLISTEKISYSLCRTRWNLNLSIITSRTKRHVLLDKRIFLLLSCSSCFFLFFDLKHFLNCFPGLFFVITSCQGFSNIHFLRDQWRSTCSKLHKKCSFSVADVVGMFPEIN